MLPFVYSDDHFKSDCILGLRNEVLKVLSLYENWTFGYVEFSVYVKMRLKRDFEIMSIATNIDVLTMFNDAIRPSDFLRTRSDYLYRDGLIGLVVDLHKLACEYTS